MEDILTPVGCKDSVDENLKTPPIQIRECQNRRMSNSDEDGDADLSGTTADSNNSSTSEHFLRGNIVDRLSPANAGSAACTTISTITTSDSLVSLSNVLNDFSNLGIQVDESHGNIDPNTVQTPTTDPLRMLTAMHDELFSRETPTFPEINRKYSQELASKMDAMLNAVMYNHELSERPGSLQQTYNPFFMDQANFLNPSTESKFEDVNKSPSQGKKSAKRKMQKPFPNELIEITSDSGGIIKSKKKKSVMPSAPSLPHEVQIFRGTPKKSAKKKTKQSNNESVDFFQNGELPSSSTSSLVGSSTQGHKEDLPSPVIKKSKKTSTSTKTVKGKNSQNGKIKKNAIVRVNNCLVDANGMNCLSIDDNDTIEYADSCHQVDLEQPREKKVVTIDDIEITELSDLNSSHESLEPTGNKYNASDCVDTSNVLAIKDNANVESVSTGDIIASDILDAMAIPLTECSHVTDDNKKVFTCPKSGCKYVGKNLVLLRKHLTHHGIFHCAHCTYVGLDFTGLESHMMANHPQRWGRKKCKTCSCYVKGAEYDQHVQTCLGRQIYPCSHCSREFKFESLLLEHESRVHLSLTCEHCDYVAKTKKAFGQHISSEHPDKKPLGAKCSKKLSANLSGSETSEAHILSPNATTSDGYQMVTSTPKHQSAFETFNYSPPPLIVGATFQGSTYTSGSGPLPSISAFTETSSSICAEGSVPFTTVGQQDICSISSYQSLVAAVTSIPSYHHGVIPSVLGIQTCVPISSGSSEPMPAPGVFCSPSQGTSDTQDTLAPSANDSIVCTTAITPLISSTITDAQVTPSWHCVECNKTFDAKVKLDKHRWKIHKPHGDLKCEQCGKTFKQRYGLKQHLLTHSDEYNYPCKEEGCQQAFKTPKLLSSHMAKWHRTTDDAPVYRCDHPDCSHTFKKKAQLKKHEVVHTGERRFICEWPGCNKAFRHNANLKIHHLLHTGEKPIKCQYCVFACRQKSSLIHHMKTKHKTINWPGGKKGSADDGEQDEAGHSAITTLTDSEGVVTTQIHLNVKDLLDENDEDDSSHSEDEAKESEKTVVKTNLSPLKSPPRTVVMSSPLDSMKSVLNSPLLVPDPHLPNLGLQTDIYDFLDDIHESVKMKTPKNSKSVGSKQGTSGAPSKTKEPAKEKKKPRPKKRKAETTPKSRPSAKVAKTSTKKKGKTPKGKGKNMDKQPPVESPPIPMHEEEKEQHEQLDNMKAQLSVGSSQDEPGFPPSRTSPASLDLEEDLAPPELKPQSIEEDEDDSTYGVMQLSLKHQSSNSDSDKTILRTPEGNHNVSDEQVLVMSPGNRDVRSPDVMSEAAELLDAMSPLPKHGTNAGGNSFDMPHDIGPAETAKVLQDADGFNGDSCNADDLAQNDLDSPRQSPVQLPEAALENKDNFMSSPMANPLHSNKEHSQQLNNSSSSHYSYNADCNEPSSEYNHMRGALPSVSQESSAYSAHRRSSDSYPPEYLPNLQNVGAPQSMLGPASVSSSYSSHSFAVSQPSDVLPVPFPPLYPPYMSPPSTTASIYPRTTSVGSTMSSTFTPITSSTFSSSIDRPDRLDSYRLPELSASPSASSIGPYGAAYPSPRDLFSHYLTESSLPLPHITGAGQDPRAPSLGYPPAPQQPLQALQRSSADFLQRASSRLPGMNYTSVEESLARQLATGQQPWLSSEDRSRAPWGTQPSPILMPSEFETASQLGRTPYGSTARPEYGCLDPSNMTSKSRDNSFAGMVPPPTQTLASDRYDMTSSYPFTTGSNYTKVLAPPTGMTPQKQLEDVYRMSSLQGPSMMDMYSRMGMNPPIGFDKYYSYSASAASYRGHTAANPFMPQTTMASPSMSYHDGREYSRNLSSYCPQDSAYSKYLPGTANLPPALQNPSDYFQTRPPAPDPYNMHDPYHRNAIHNMMNMSRYF